MNIFLNKKILIYGLGISGLSTYKFLKNKNDIFLYDDNKLKIKTLGTKENLISYKEILKTKFDQIFISPGIDINKCKLSKFLKKNYNKVFSDLDVFFSFYKNDCITITGTNGKSTTCQLMYEVLLSQKFDTKLIGNIGNPVLSVKNVKKKTVFVIEASSYQLEYSRIFKSKYAVILNLSPDHIERHKNLNKYIEKYGDNIPIKYHPEIRNHEACYLSSSAAIKLAKKTGARLHVFHLSTAKETNLFSNKLPLEKKKITAEVCIHHLWFSDKDYETHGSRIKWNPAVKSSDDRDALWQALLDDRIDVIATDHAPHTIEEKESNYTSCPSGGPLVQHALPAMLEAFHKNKISLEKIVEKMCHNPAILFKIQKRGFIRPGYHADLVIFNLTKPWTVNKTNILYKCGWSPFEGKSFKSRISHTIINGKVIFDNFKFSNKKNAKRLKFDR